MRVTQTLLALGFVVASVAAAAGSEEDYSRGLVLQWQSAAPTCFDSQLPLEERLESVAQFVVGGEFTEPRKIKGESPRTEHFEGIELSTGLPVMELVINKAGKVELVVSLRTTMPEFDARLAQILSEWEFEPSTRDGEPKCMRYILTLFIDYY